MNPIDLHKQPKIKSGFKVPENYFDELESKITAQLAIEEPKVIRLNPNRKYWFSAVAAIIILAVSIPLYQNWKMNTAPLDDESIEQINEKLEILNLKLLYKFLNVQLLHYLNF